MSTLENMLGDCHWGEGKGIDPKRGTTVYSQDYNFSAKAVYIPINIGELVSRMYSLYAAFGQSSSWFASNDDVHRILSQFVLTYDIFWDSRFAQTMDPVIMVQPSPNIHPTGHAEAGKELEVLSNPSYLSFEFQHNEPLPREGALIHLIPTFCRPFDRDNFRPLRSANVTWTSDASWLRWDDGFQGFGGKIPLFSQMRSMKEVSVMRLHSRALGQDVMLIRFVVKALEVEELGDSNGWTSIHHERTVRAQISMTAALQKRGHTTTNEKLAPNTPNTFCSADYTNVICGKRPRTVGKDAVLIDLPYPSPPEQAHDAKPVLEDADMLGLQLDDNSEASMQRQRRSVSTEMEFNDIFLSISEDDDSDKGECQEEEEEEAEKKM